MIKNQIIQNFQNHKINKKGCKTKDSILKPFDKKIMCNEFKMFKFRCAKFDSTPTFVQISNYKIPKLKNSLTRSKTSHHNTYCYGTCVTKKRGSTKNPTNSYTVHYRPCLAFLLLISLSTTDTDFLHTMTSF